MATSSQVQAVATAVAAFEAEVTADVRTAHERSDASGIGDGIAGPNSRPALWGQTTSLHWQAWRMTSSAQDRRAARKGKSHSVHASPLPRLSGVEGN